MSDRAAADPIARDFRRYLLSRAVSVTGALTSLVVMPVLVYQLTGSAAWTAAVAAAEALPYLLFGLLAGALADRVDRRRVMIGADLVAAAALVGIPVAWWLDGLGAVQVLVVAVVVQAAFVFFDAANFGALPTLVGKPRLTAAYSTLFGVTTVLELLVPPLAGLAVVVLSPPPLLGIHAATAIASALLLRRIVAPLSEPVPAGRRRTVAGVPRAIREGLRFVWDHPTIRTLTALGAANAVAGGAWVAMLVPWADRVLGIAPAGDVRLALLFGCYGIGGIAASRLVPALSARLGGARLALLALPAALLCSALVLGATHWAWAVVAVIAFAAAHSTVVLNAITYRQQLCPMDRQARVNTTARMLSWGVGSPTGAVLAGAVASTPAGPRAGLAVGVLALAVATAGGWLGTPLRHAARQTAGGPTARTVG